MSIASKVRSIPDFAAGVTLRSTGEGAETSTATEPGVSIEQLPAYWSGDRISDGMYAATFVVTSINVDTDEGYLLQVVTDDNSSAGDSPVVVASVEVSSVGVFVLAIDFATIRALDTDDSTGERYIFARAVLSGSAPSIDYSATLGKLL